MSSTYEYSDVLTAKRSRFWRQRHRHQPLPEVTAVLNGARDMADPENNFDQTPALLDPQDLVDLGLRNQLPPIGIERNGW